MGITSSPKDVTQMLVEWSNGNKEALAQLMPLVYDELRRLADHYLRRQRPGHTLQTTALVRIRFDSVIRKSTRVRLAKIRVDSRIAIMCL